MPSINFTVKWIEALKAPKTAAEGLWWDTGTKGLGLRVNDQGERFFVVNVTVKGGNRHRVALGPYGHELTLEQARQRAAEYTSAARKGIDLYEDEIASRGARAARLTFNEVAAKWIDLHVKPKRSERTAYDYEANLRRYLKPTFGKRTPDTISRAEVTELHGGMADRPKAANYAIVTGKAMMNFAIKNDLVPKGTGNPFAGIELYPEEGRERFLSADEIGHIGTAIRDLENEGRLSPWTAAALRLLMLTGARSGEIKTCKWEFVDFDRKALLLPKSKTGRKTIHLNPPAVAILQALPRVNGNAYVIVGQINSEPIATLRQAWEHVRDRTGLHDVRIHDLRHTYA